MLSGLLYADEVVSMCEAIRGLRTKIKNARLLRAFESYL